MKKLMILSIILATMVPCAAAIITVDPNGSADYTTIQAAIDNANDGDTVIVADGTYTDPGNRDIDFLGKAITVKSANGPDNCIIDCEWLGRGFIFQNNEEPESVLSGFTIKYGLPGILCKSYSSPQITYCTLYENGDSGILCESYSSPQIKNCIFQDNFGGHGGGVGCIDNSTPKIVNCMFQNNHGGFGGGIGCVYDSCPTVTNCVFYNNIADYGGGIGTIVDVTCEVKITNCIFMNNSEGAVVAGTCEGDNGAPILRNCIVWNDPITAGPEVYGDHGNAKCHAPMPLVQYSILPPGWQNQYVIGENIIVSDPNFISGPLGDYYLSYTAAGQDSNSPCIDAGSDTAANLGMDESTTRTDGVWDTGVVDMGYHYPRNIADLYYDGYVDLNDLLIVASKWLDAPGTPSADIAPETPDNFVDYLDFSVIGQNWQGPQ